MRTAWNGGSRVTDSMTLAEIASRLPNIPDLVRRCEEFVFVLLGGDCFVSWDVLLPGGGLYQSSKFNWRLGGCESGVRAEKGTVAGSE